MIAGGASQAGEAVQADTLLRIHALTKHFGATVALDGVTVDVRAGEVHALVGENGAGKSTLMNVIAGALAPDRGEMLLDGRPYRPASPLHARRAGIALIHQELSLCPHLTVAENVLLGVERARRGWINRRDSRERAAELLHQFGRSDIDPDRRVATLPLAARQVVEICRALAADARILLMDEPTSAFQRHDTERLFALTRQLAERGIAVVYISHFLEEVREIATRYTVLRDGRTVDRGRIADVTNDHLIAKMVGRSVAGHFPQRSAANSGDIVLSVSDLSAPPALKHASFDVRRGEVLGIFGLIGSGRTELIRALFGLDTPRSGRIVLRGRALSVGASPGERVKAGFGYVSEDRKVEGLTLPMSIADNITATRMSAFTRMRLGLIDRAMQHAYARDWITRLRIRAASTEQAVRALSGGNQQKVAIGRLLHQDASVLLLDEPTRGIDVGSKEEVYSVIAQCADAGKAVIMVSSYIPELLGLCDRVAVMCRGRLLPARPARAWTSEELLRAAMGAAGEIVT